MGCTYAKLRHVEDRDRHEENGPQIISTSDSASSKQRNVSRKNSGESDRSPTSASSKTLDFHNDQFHMPVIILRNERVAMEKLSIENPLPAWLKKMKSFDCINRKRQTKAYVNPPSRCTSFKEVLVATEVVEPVFLDEVDRLCDAKGIRPLLTSKITDEYCTLKDGVRAQEKAIDRYDGDFSRLFDVLRASIVCSDYDALQFAWTRVISNPAWKVLRLKNRFLSPSLTGYRDLLVIIELETEGVVHLCELQIHLEVFENASTFTYHYFRRVPPNVAQEFMQLSPTRFLELTYAFQLWVDLRKHSRGENRSTKNSGVVPSTMSTTTASTTNAQTARHNAAHASRFPFESDPPSREEMQLIRSVVSSVQPEDLRSLLAMAEESAFDDSLNFNSKKFGLDEASLSTHDASWSQYTH